MQVVSYAASAIIGNKAERAGSRKEAVVSGWGFAKGNGLPTMMDKKYEEYALMFEKIFSGEMPPQWDKKEEDGFAGGMDNTSIADYVWLPLRFAGDMVYIDWKDEWRIEDYE